MKSILLMAIVTLTFFANCDSTDRSKLNRKSIKPKSSALLNGPSNDGAGALDSDLNGDRSIITEVVQTGSVSISSVDATTTELPVTTIQKIEPLAITKHPVSATLNLGESHVLTVEVNRTNSENIDYQWLNNGDAIANAIDASFKIDSAAASDDSNYSVSVTSAGVVVKSNEVSVKIIEAEPGCVDLDWTPAENLYCPWEEVDQTSNCSATRKVEGTKTGASCCRGPGECVTTNGETKISCNLPWGETLTIGEEVLAYSVPSIEGDCSQYATMLACTTSGLSESSTYKYKTCTKIENCPDKTIEFGWGTIGSGNCTATLSSSKSGWVFTSKEDDFVGGIPAQECTNNTWVIINNQAAKCVAKGTGEKCFSQGTKCDGSGPATWPHPHCWVCCNKTSASGPACL